MYTFQFGFLQPIASVVNSQIPIAIFSLILLFIALINNKFMIKKYVMIVFLIVSILFLFNALMYSELMNISLNTYIEFILKGFSAFIIASFDIDTESMYNSFFKLSILNFLCIVMYPFTNFFDSMNYMRFGYAILPSVIMFILLLKNKKENKFIYFILFSISITLMVLYGSRGALIPIVILIVLLFIFDTKYKRFIKLIIVFLMSTLSIIVYKLNIIGKIIDYVYFDLNIKTYTIMKFQRMFSSGFLETTSGRDQIYINTLEYIRSSPIVGLGVGYSEIKTGYKPHNFILQILSETGIIGLIIWICIFAFCLYKYNNISKEDKYLFYILTLLISISVGRLSVSSDIWLRPELWLFMSLIFSYKSNFNHT